jgi:SAM-dependent methyltransferase
MTTETAFRKIQEIWIGYWGSQSLYVAAKLGIADCLVGGPKTAQQLAREVGAEPQSLYRVLRFLAGLGVFEMSEERRFGLNMASELMLTTAQGSVRDSSILLGETVHEAWRKLLPAVQDGHAAFEHAFRQGLFEYLGKHPHYARIFDRAMAAGSVFFRAVPDVYDFSSLRRVVDVGGGNGAMLAAILGRNPKLTGVLFDAPSVVDAARPNLEVEGVAGRCELVKGDFFESIVTGGDVYILSRILHDWEDNQCLAILRNCRRAIDRSGRVLILERLIPGSYALASDVNMLAVTGGRERSEEEFRKLLAQTGFELSGVIPLPLEVNLIEATPTLNNDGLLSPSAQDRHIQQLCDNEG